MPLAKRPRYPAVPPAGGGIHDRGALECDPSSKTAPRSSPSGGIRLRVYPPRGYDSSRSEKEALGEGTRKVPVREPVLRLSGRSNGRPSARIPEGRRQPRSTAAPLEDHRGERRGRPPHHARRLPE